MSKYQIKTDLSEKQIEADVAQFFGWISKGVPFRLLDVDERITGADKQFYDRGFAFFLQYKVSKGLEPISRVPVSNRKNQSRLEDVRLFRDQSNLADDPTLYFQLHRLAKNATDYQHNILMNHANTGWSQAFYVAPLHLDKLVYYNTLMNSVNRYQYQPVTYRNSNIYQHRWVSYIGHVPFLKEHVSIIPHERVNTHKHIYAYSSTGTDISWHSPELLSEGPSRLSDVLVRTIRECFAKDSFLSLEELDSKIEVEQKISDSNDHPVERIMGKARALSEDHNIRLTLLLVNSEHLNRWRDIL